MIVMAGPCSVESREQIVHNGRSDRESWSARFCAAAHSSRVLRLTAFRAWAKMACKLMREAGERIGLLVISEVMEISQIPLMLPYVGYFPGRRAQYAELQSAARTRQRCASRFC